MLNRNNYHHFLAFTSYGNTFQADHQTTIKPQLVIYRVILAPSSPFPMHAVTHAYFVFTFTPIYHIRTVFTFISFYTSFVFPFEHTQSSFHPTLEFYDGLWIPGAEELEIG